MVLPAGLIIFSRIPVRRGIVSGACIRFRRFFIGVSGLPAGIPAALIRIFGGLRVISVLCFRGCFCRFCILSRNIVGQSEAAIADGFLIDFTNGFSVIPLCRFFSFLECLCRVDSDPAVRERFRARFPCIRQGAQRLYVCRQGQVGLASVRADRAHIEDPRLRCLLAV